MTFKISDDRFHELLQIEEELNCEIGAGYSGSYLREFFTDPSRFKQVRHLQAIVLTEFQSLLQDLNLGVGGDAAFSCGRTLLIERLMHPSPEVQECLWSALQDGQTVSPQSQHAEVKAILATVLTQADWAQIATAAADSIRLHVLDYPTQVKAS